VQEGANITAALQVGFAKMKAVSGGMINVNGLARIQEIKINSGGIFDGKNLKTKDTKISVTAVGEAHIYASEKVEIRVAAGGNVYVHGHPNQVKKKRLVGGCIYIID
jgi:co-chaperonin GroES (HSP10)